MIDKALIKEEAVVKKILGNRWYAVTLTTNKQDIRAYASGNIVRNYIKIYEGDRVDVEISPDDPQKGRIVYRYRN